VLVNDDHGEGLATFGVDQLVVGRCAGALGVDMTGAEVERLVNGWMRWEDMQRAVR
jgi:hypothetical protein